MIVHATVEHAGFPWGGIAIAVDLLASATSRAGRRTLVLSVGAEAKRYVHRNGYDIVIVACPEVDGDIIYQFPNRLTIGKDLSGRFFREIETLRCKEEVDLFVHNEELAQLCMLAGNVSWVRCRAAVNHGLLKLEHPDRTDLIQLQTELLESADIVFALSEHQAQQVQISFAGVQNVAYLPLPLEILLDEVRVSHAVRIMEQVDRHIILAAGRAVRQKGFDILIKAIDQMPESVEVGLKLELGHGDAAYLAACRHAARQSRHPVMISDWVPRSELLVAMSLSALVAIPSRFEPLGLVAAEAMAVGTPVVASQTGGLTELIAGDDTSLTVPVHGTDGPPVEVLAATLLEVLEQAPQLTRGDQILKTRYGLDRCLSVIDAHTPQ
jgi:glycosyltransferase involved in cell wall biosynthesis